MPRFKLTFEYDGTDFSGWQIQPEARTVEGVVEEALSTLFQERIDIVGQGRTDAGVHALAQTAHADLPDDTSPHRMLNAMKGLLPVDVAMISAEAVSDSFHARFDAALRTYRYSIHLKHPSPLKRRTSWFVPYELNLELLHECAGLIKGEHDFRNFCVPPEVAEMTTQCVIKKSEWEIIESDNRLEYRIDGNRFLRHLVRRLAGTMIQAASGKLTITEFQDLLEGPPARQKGHSAPAHGLTLMNVTYD